jgi:hypothetical protein
MYNDIETDEKYTNYYCVSKLIMCKIGSFGYGRIQRLSILTQHI